MRNPRAQADQAVSAARKHAAIDSELSGLNYRGKGRQAALADRIRDDVERLALAGNHRTTRCDGGGRTDDRAGQRPPALDALA